jgi:predicted nuclease with TOPRIM domain
MAINVPIVSEFSDKGLKKAMNEFKRLEKTSQKVGFALNKAFLPATAALGGLAAAAIPAINAASDLEESMSKVGVIFGEGAKEVEAFAETAAKALGQSKQDVLEAAGTFGTFGKAAGLAGTDLAQFSNDMTALASDVASFNNAEPDEVIQAMGAALRGEAEPMRRFGVLLNDAVLKQEALALGIYDGNGALNDQQKILAAQQAIFKQTGDAQGDFARTSEGLANQTRIMKAQFEDVKAELGKALLPIVLKILPVFADLADFVSNNTELILTLGAVIGGLSAAIVVANFAMKAWAAVQAIATAAQWAFNAALTANPIGLVVIAVAALAAGLVILYKKSEKVRAVLDAMFGVLGKVGDAIGWVAEKLGIASKELENNFTPSVDEARKQAGDMYASVRDANTGLDELDTISAEAAESQDELAASVNAVYEEVKKINPELDAMFALLDVQDDMERLRDSFDKYNEVLQDSESDIRDVEEAQREVTRQILNTLDAHGLLSLALQDQLLIKINTSQLDAAYDSALRVLDAFQKVQAVSAGRTPSTYIPTPTELEFRTGNIQTIDVRPTGTATRDLTSGQLQNITVNVNTPTPSEEIGKVVVDSIRKYNRTSGAAAIRVS